MAKAKKGSKGEAPASAVNTAAGRKFATVRNITLPVLKISIEVPVYITIKDAMRVSQTKERPTKDGEAKKGPATVCTVVNLETGEVNTLIVSAVVKSIFEDEYPGGAYVGKSFCLVKHAKKEGKNYFNFSVDEIDPEQPTDTAP